MSDAGGIVWLASFPKSGNTWLRILLANLLTPDDGPVDINRLQLNSRPLVSRRLLDNMTLIDTSLLTREELDLLRPRIAETVAADSAEHVYVKVHDNYRTNRAGKPLFALGRRNRALYIVRDPRDVAVSLSYHTGRTTDWAISELNSPHYTISSAIGYWTKQIPQLLTDWSRHVESWTGQRDLPVHVLRYEDLQADPIGTFGKAAAFLGLDASRAAVEQAVRRSDFAELQRQEQRTGFRERWRESTAPFFRAGRAGGWKEVLTPEQEHAIVVVHRPVMARFGYI